MDHYACARQTAARQAVWLCLDFLTHDNCCGKSCSHSDYCPDCSISSSGGFVHIAGHDNYGLGELCVSKGTAVVVGNITAGKDLNREGLCALHVNGNVGNFAPSDNAFVLYFTVNQNRVADLAVSDTLGFKGVSVALKRAAVLVSVVFTEDCGECINIQRADVVYELGSRLVIVACMGGNALGILSAGNGDGTAVVGANIDAQLPVIVADNRGGGSQIAQVDHIVGSGKLQSAGDR